MKEVEKVVEINRQNEIDLLDLLKIIIRNKKIILITWLGVLIAGIFFGIYKEKTSLVQAERKFEVKEIELGIINPISFFDNQEFIEIFFQKDKIKEISKEILEKKTLIKRAFIKEVYNVSNNGNVYNLKLSGKTFEEIEKLEEIYFEVVNNYIQSIYGEIVKKDIETIQNQANINKEELSKLEQKIRILSKNMETKEAVSNLKDIYPSIFAEKDAIAAVYGENYKIQKKYEGILIQLNDPVRMKSSLNELENKLSLKLIVVISNVLGIFLGVFLVFLKEFVKSVNWKELKEVK